MWLGIDKLQNRCAVTSQYLPGKSCSSRDTGLAACLSFQCPHYQENTGAPCTSPPPPSLEQEALDCPYRELTSLSLLCPGCNKGGSTLQWSVKEVLLRAGCTMMPSQDALDGAQPCKSSGALKVVNHITSTVSISHTKQTAALESSGDSIERTSHWTLSWENTNE